MPWIAILLSLVNIHKLVFIFPFQSILLVAFKLLDVLLIPLLYSSWGNVFSILTWKTPGMWKTVYCYYAILRDFDLLWVYYHKVINFKNKDYWDWCSVTFHAFNKSHESRHPVSVAHNCFSSISILPEILLALNEFMEKNPYDSEKSMSNGNNDTVIIEVSRRKRSIWLNGRLQVRCL